MVRTKDEILEAIKGRIGDDSSDETIAFLEDITDTLNDYDNKTKTETDWKAKYEENDKEWRKRYRDRFFNNSDDVEQEKEKIIIEEKEEPEEKTSFDELFSTGEE